MQTDKLKSLFKEGEKLVGQLDRSLSLQTIWPSVFEHGQAKSHIKRTYLKGDFVITRGDGETKSFHIEKTLDSRCSGFIYLTKPTNKDVDNHILNFSPIGSRSTTPNQ